MSRDKQIEEMAKAQKCNSCIHNAVCEKLEEVRDPLGWVNTEGEFVCSYYDKSTEVAEEIFEEIDGCYVQMLEEVDSTIEEAILEENHSLARTAKYGKDVMLLTLDTLRKRLKKKYTEEGKCQK